MNDIFRRPWLLYPAMTVLSLVFLLSFWTKFQDPAYFVQSVTYYQLFPLSLLNIAAVYLIFLELVLAIGIWVPKYRREASFVIGLLLMFFILIILISVLRGLDISCGCFGEHSARAGSGKLLENTALLFLTFIVYRSEQ